MLMIQLSGLNSPCLLQDGHFRVLSAEVRSIAHCLQTECPHQGMIMGLLALVLYSNRQIAHSGVVAIM